MQKLAGQNRTIKDSTWSIWKMIKFNLRVQHEAMSKIISLLQLDTKYHSCMVVQQL